GAKSAPGRGDLLLRDDDLLDAELAREHAGMRGARAAAREEHEVARIEPLLHRHLADDVRHLEFGDARDAGGGLVQAEPERPRDALDGGCGLGAIEIFTPAREGVRG